jgi:hypothetical protein
MPAIGAAIRPNPGMFAASFSGNCSLSRFQTVLLSIFRTLGPRHHGGSDAREPLDEPQLVVQVRFVEWNADSRHMRRSWLSAPIRPPEKCDGSLPITPIYFHIWLT